MKIGIGFLVLAALARAHTGEDDAVVEDVDTDEVVKVSKPRKSDYMMNRYT